MASVKLGDLRESLRVERRSREPDGAGNFVDQWLPLITGIRAKIAFKPPSFPKSETNQNGTLQDHWEYEITFKWTLETGQINSGDRLVDERDPNNTWNIVWRGNYDEKKFWMNIGAVQGGADG